MRANEGHGGGCPSMLHTSTKLAQAMPKVSEKQHHVSESYSLSHA